MGWSEFLDPEEARAESIVFDPGNQFGYKKSDYGFFFAIPIWWRGFIFHILSAAEFMMYAYLCSQMSLRATAFPTGEHFKRDLRRVTNTTVYGLVDRLETLGFILKNQHAPLKRVRTLRNVYQRPAPEYTLVRLLDLGLIDGDLRPVAQAVKKTPKRRARTVTISKDDYDHRHGAAVQLGLQKLLEQEDYRKYKAAAAENRRALLKEFLVASLERRRLEAKNVTGKSKRKSPKSAA
jgi:hypothetical protein